MIIENIARYFYFIHSFACQQNHIFSISIILMSRYMKDNDLIHVCFIAKSTDVYYLANHYQGRFFLFIHSSNYTLNSALFRFPPPLHFFAFFRLIKSTCFSFEGDNHYFEDKRGKNPICMLKHVVCEYR